MGNGQTKQTNIIQQTIANKKKSFSFDTGDFNNFNIQKIKPINITNNTHISSSLDLKPTSHQQQSHIMPSITMNRQSSSVMEMVRSKKMTIKQQNAKLQKLNKNNDQLRKQLILINQKLTQQLQKKKVPKIISNKKNRNNININNKQRSLTTSSSKTMTQKSQQKLIQQKDKFKIIALKKQLQNAYNQVSNYKKQLQSLKKNNPQQTNIKISSYEDKIIIIDQQINEVQKSLSSTRDIVNKQRIAIGQYQSQIGGSEVQQIKRQIVMLKQRLKQIKQISRKKQKEQKLRHQLLIQMQRKLRQVNGQYLPQFKNWSQLLQTPQQIKQSRILSLKNRIKTKNNNTQKDTTQQQNDIIMYIPTKTEFDQIIKQHTIAKRTHQQFNKKMYNQLKKRVQYKQERQKIQQKLLGIEKTLQNLYYKKDRYMQIIMTNNKSIDSNNGGDNINYSVVLKDNNNIIDINLLNNSLNHTNPIIVGENIPGQVQFSDKKVIKNYQKVLDKLKIVTVNVWINEHQHIVAIQLFYTDGESFFVGSKSAEINVPTQKRTLQLQQGDWVYNVMGIFNSKTKYLQFVMFESIRGKVLKVGRQSFKNNNFNLGLSRNQRIVCVQGACTYDGISWRINKLQFTIRK